MNVVAHGIDAVNVKRFAKILDLGGRDFLARSFTENEIAAASKYRTTERFAAWFAVKEAILKALGTGQSNGATFTDIEIGHTPLGSPIVTLFGATKEIALEQGIKHWLVSITTIEELAIASVIGTSC